MKTLISIGLITIQVTIVTIVSATIIPTADPRCALILCQENTNCINGECVPIENQNNNQDNYQANYQGSYQGSYQANYQGSDESNYQNNNPDCSTIRCYEGYHCVDGRCIQDQEITRRKITCANVRCRYKCIDTDDGPKCVIPEDSAPKCSLSASASGQMSVQSQQNAQQKNLCLTVKCSSGFRCNPLTGHCILEHLAALLHVPETTTIKSKCQPACKSNEFCNEFLGACSQMIRIVGRAEFGFAK